jgi:DNA modification methylase
MSERIASIDLRRFRVSDLKPHPKNPRTHPKPGSPLWEVLKRSLDHDLFDPLCWNEANGYLVSGHLRLKVLAELGFTLVDVSVVNYTEELHYARMIAANKPLGDFEEQILKELAGEIEAASIDAALACMENKALLAMLDPPPITDDSDQTENLVSKADELQSKWQVQLGDLFEVGNHRLLCGDCASLDNWHRLLPGRVADMVWTDPPYNIKYEAIQERRNELKRQQGGSSNVVPQPILNDDLTAKDYADKLKTWFAAAFEMCKPGAPIYIAHADIYRVENELAAKSAGWSIHQNIVRVKNGFTLGRQDYQWQHEPVLYGWKPGAAHHWQGGYKRATLADDQVDLKKKSKAELMVMINEFRNALDTTVVREPRNTGNGLHPTIKPVGLVARQIWNSSRRGDTILELFGGSGTTLAAAEQLGRRCVATELHPEYCAVILERLSLLGLPVEKASIET